MKRIVLTSAILLFEIYFGFSQNQRVADSLIKIVKTEKLSEKTRIRYLVLIAYHHPNIDTALYLAKKSLKLASKIDEPFLQALALEEISNKENIIGNNINSINASLQSLKIYDSLGLIEKQAASYGQLANNYMLNKEYKPAIDYLQKSKKIFLMNENVINREVKLIYLELNLGEMYRLSGDLDSAKLSFKDVLKVNKKYKNQIAESYSLGNLGMIYNTQDSLFLAKVHLQDAIVILKELGDPYATSVYLAELGDVYQKERKSNLAEEKFLESMSMAQEAGLKEQIRDFSEKLTLFYETQGNYNKALAYQKQFQIYQDSLVNKANIQEIERLKAGYEIDKRESEIGLLNKVNTNQKYLLWALGGGVLGTLIFLYLLYRGNQRIKRANTKLAEQKEVITQREQEKALLLRELNHRVKNNLQMISSLLNLQSNELTGHPAKAALLAGKDRVEALSLVHRKLYQEGAETKIALQDYVEELVLGLFHGYQANFEPDFEIEDLDIPIDTAIPLALIINELVINALKYAYKGVENPSLIMKIKKVGALLHIAVRDNGKGFSSNESENQNSFGLKLINSLTQQLEGTLKKINDEGTHWQVELKIAS